jgi:hypothetical protein
MMIEILQSAQEEIELAFLFYESQKRGLGFEFLEAIESSYHHILSNPKAWAVLHLKSKTFRRCFLRRFPYGLIYAIEKEKLLVIAVMHLARKPGYWRGHLKPKPLFRQRKEKES